MDGWVEGVLPGHITNGSADADDVVGDETMMSLPSKV